MSLLQRKRIFEDWERLEEELKQNVHEVCSAGRSIIQNPMELDTIQIDQYIKEMSKKIKELKESMEKAGPEFKKLMKDSVRSAYYQ